MNSSPQVRDISGASGAAPAMPERQLHKSSAWSAAPGRHSVGDSAEIALATRQGNDRPRIIARARQMIDAGARGAEIAFDGAGRIRRRRFGGDASRLTAGGTEC